MYDPFSHGRQAATQATVSADGSRYFDARQQALRERLAARKLPNLLVTKPANIFYLTGFRGSAGVLIWSASECVLFVDPRYTLQAQEEGHGVQVVEARGGLLRAAAKWLKARRTKTVGFDHQFLTCSDYNTLRREASTSVQWAPAGGLVEDLRLIKDELEVSQIRRACALTAEVYSAVSRKLQPGISEIDVAAEIEFRMRRKGAEGTAFETIVTSGPRAAFPHARPSAKLLRAGELVIFDLGAMLGGYMADMTRTVFLGAPNRRIRSLYRGVVDAQACAIEILRAGVKAQQVDMAARRTLARRKLDKYFTHSTGHGVGIEIHERPRLGKSEKSRLPAGTVVTVEPGVYIEGLGGVRIEDTVWVKKTGPELLTPANKESWWLD